MFFERKTTDGAWWQILLVPVGIFVLFFSTFALFGRSISFYILGGIYMAYSIYPLIVFFKMKNPGHLIQSTFMIAVGLVCLAAPSAFDGGPAVKIIPIFLFFMYLSMLMLFYQAFNRKIKWRGLEILELAAIPVEAGESGYTPRPRPVGQIDISSTEIARFTDFVTRELISIVFYEKDNLFFVPVRGNLEYLYMLGIKQDYIDETWIALDSEGRLSSHISEKDYLKYKMDLDFDRLCESLGEVYKEFIQLSTSGQEKRIIDKMNALRLPFFS